jgi:hypothetical protein
MSAVTLPVVHRRPAAKRKLRNLEDLCFVWFEAGNSTEALAIYCQVLTSQVTGSCADRDRPVIGHQVAAAKIGSARQVRLVIIKSLSVSAGSFGGVTARPMPGRCSGPPTPACLPCHGTRPRVARQWLVPGLADDVTVSRTFVTGDAIARPQPGRTAASYYPVSREQREFTVTCPSFRTVRYAGQAFITDHLAVDPGNPEAIRSHFAKPLNRAPGAIRTRDFRLLPARWRRPQRPVRAVPGTRATVSAGEPHHGRPAGVRICLILGNLSPQVRVCTEGC